MQIHIDIDDAGKRVTLTSSWRPGIADDCKSIAGASWSKTRSQWSYPLSMTTLRRLREVFGQDLAPSQRLWEWAKSEARKEKELKLLSTVHDANLQHVPSVAPQLALAMQDRTYQRSAARFAAVAHNYLLADEPGLGKTATALAGLMESQAWTGNVLILAPKTSLSSVWERQVKMWTGSTRAVAMPEGAAQREAAWKRFQALGDHPTEPRMLIANPAMIRRLYGHFCAKCEVWEEDTQGRSAKVSFPLNHHMEEHKTKREIRKQEWEEIIDFPWDTAILDESHYLLAAYTPSNVTQQTQGLLDLRATRRIALTGTPLRGEERRIWGTLNWLDPKAYGGYWAFVGDFFEIDDNGFGKTVGALRPDRADAFYQAIDRRVLRRTRAEVRGDLPLGQRFTIEVKMSSAQKKQYEEFARMGEAALIAGTVSGQGVLSELTRLKQLAYGSWTRPDADGKITPTADSPKLETIIQFLKERGITGKPKTDWFPEQGSAYKYVIASQYTEILNSVERELNKVGIATLKVSGDVTGKRRNTVVEKFQSDDRSPSAPRVMLIQTQTGGVAIELDAWCDEMLILDETYIADDQVQLEGRINNRSGRVAPRTWWYLITQDTIDEGIHSGNLTQHNLQHALLDGRRGVEIALHLIRGDKK